MSDFDEVRMNETRKAALASSIAFQNLGEPIQKLLFVLNSEVSDEDLSLLSKITVRQLAKVFDMMSAGEDPEKILAWLRRAAKKNIEGDDPYQNERKKKVTTGASRDPIAFYKEIERRNQELQERHRKAAEAREKRREELRARREAEREANRRRAAEERQRAAENGEKTTALDRLKEKDQRDLTNTFERFVNKQSTYDNSMKAQDGEWWKKDEYRREFEKLGKKGQKWRSVVEFGNSPATEAELAQREEWYKSQCWWKSDKYRNDWVKTREVEWWKETPYIQDWQDKGAKGAKWTAVDETNGFNSRGQQHSASMEELNRRIDWYKQNGPKGVQKLWNALAEGVQDRCTLEEKREREDYYKNADWWRCDDEFRKYNSVGANCCALKVAGPCGEDREWWKEEKYRKDFDKGGDSWKCANETAVYQGKQKEVPATEAEQERRADWFKNNWWKAQACIDDFNANGEKGTFWRARDEASAKSGSPKACKESEAQQRAAWYNSLPDREWWKDDEYRQDYEQNGPNGKKWQAASQELGNAGRGDELPAADAERRKREDFYKQTWWKADKYKKDFLENPKSSAWKAKDGKVNQDKDWWKQPQYRDDWKKNARKVPDSEFWKRADAIEDFQKNGDAGKVWNAQDALTGSVKKGDKKPASGEELAKRKKWLEDNWWRAPKYENDWAANGVTGNLWTAATEGSKQMATPEQLHERAEAYKQTGPQWRALTETDGINNEGQKRACANTDAIDRADWYRKNWWKMPEAVADYEKNGANGEVWRAASEEAGQAKKGGDAEYQATPEELKEREDWYNKSSDLDFWKDPAYIEDYNKKKGDGALWQAQNPLDARRALGKERPASKEQLKERENWYNANHWKSPEAQADFAKNGAKGDVWTKATATGSDKASPAELQKREAWLKAHAEAPEEELKHREDYLRNQLTDQEIKHRHAWLDNKGKEDKCINRDELPELLQALNQGVAPTPDQIAAVDKAIEDNRRKNMVVNADPESISQEEFVHAVADAGFYVAPTEEEAKMNEDEALEEMEREEMARVEEEAAFLSMEAEEERAAAGDDGAAADEGGDDEEAKFLEEEAEARESKPNEDDIVTDEQEQAWQDFQAAPSPLPMDDDDVKKREKQRAEDEARRVAEEQAWKEEGQADDAPEEEGAEEAMELKDEDKQDLQAEVEEDENAEWQEDGEEEAAEEEPKTEEHHDEMSAEEKAAPQPWKLPLPKVTNPQYFKAYFTVLKYVPKSTLMGGKQKRVWVVDHFSRSFYNMDTSGKIKKEHAANKLLQLEKNMTDPKRVRLMFFDASHSYELSFQNAEERERFFESASAIRPSIRVYAPGLTKPDSTAETCSTTIDGVGKNTVVVKVPNVRGEIVDRELTGECKVNASRMMTEPLTVWTGTFNLGGAAPPKNPNDMGKWIPKGKFDLYAIAIQEGSYQREENEWFQYIQNFIGKDYLTLANMNLWDTYLIVLTKKKNLLKITNVEGSTKATQHKNVCGTKGGVGISLRFHETTMCFVACQLAARPERTAMRNTNLEEIIDCLQLSNKDTDFTQQFHHVFFMGDLNYRLDMDDTTALPLLKANDYAKLLEADQLNQQRAKEGILHGFLEAPIKFRPTYRFNKGTTTYAAEKGQAPSYTDRILVKSMPNTWIRCLTYESCEALPIGEHLPVSSSYIVRAVRPCMACFHPVQQPRVRFTFPSIKVLENNGTAIKKPVCMICTGYSDSPHTTQPAAEGTTPAWSGEAIPHVDMVNHIPEFLETQQVMFIIRDQAEKRDDKALRGTACLSLKDMITNKQDQEQTVKLDLIVHGKRSGYVEVKLKWIARQRGV